jgi:hypothetical protein
MIDIYEKIDDNTIALELDTNVYKVIAYINGKLVSSTASTIEIALTELENLNARK